MGELPAVGRAAGRFGQAPPFVGLPLLVRLTGGLASTARRRVGVVFVLFASGGGLARARTTLSYVRTPTTKGRVGTGRGSVLLSNAASIC